jgi:hypothetical protein
MLSNDEVLAPLGLRDLVLQNLSWELKGISVARKKFLKNRQPHIGCAFSRHPVPACGWIACSLRSEKFISCRVFLCSFRVGGEGI